MEGKIISGQINVLRKGLPQAARRTLAEFKNGASEFIYNYDLDVTLDNNYLRVTDFVRVAGKYMFVVITQDRENQREYSLRSIDPIDEIPFSDNRINVEFVASSCNC